MNESIKSAFHDLEQNRHEVMSFVSNFAEEELQKCPEDSWCMIQALRHVEMSEAGAVRYLTRKVQAGDQLAIRPLRPRLLLQLLHLVFLMRIKFKAPEVIAHPPITTLAQLADDWEHTRHELKRFIESFPEKWNDRAIFKHPFIGMLSLSDAISFLQTHQRHHIKQVYRIRRMLRSNMTSVVNEHGDDKTCCKEKKYHVLSNFVHLKQGPCQFHAKTGEYQT